MLRSSLRFVRQAPRFRSIEPLYRYRASARFSGGPKKGEETGGDLGKFVENLKTHKSVDASMKATAAAPKSEAKGAGAKKKKASLSSVFYNKRKGPTSYAAFFGMLLTGAGVVAYYNVGKQRMKEESRKGQAKSFGKAKLGGPYSLVDQDGKPVTDKDFKGQYVLLYFGFTYCPDICPHELVKLGRAIDRLDKMNLKHQVQPIFISVDPKRDSVAQLKEYAKDFHPRLISLTGTPGQVERTCRAYRVFYQNTNETKEDEEDYLVDHSIISYLIGPNGEFIDFFTQQREPDEIVEIIKDRIENEVGIDVLDDDDEFKDV